MHHKNTSCIRHCTLQDESFSYPVGECYIYNNKILAVIWQWEKIKDNTEQNVVW